MMRPVESDESDLEAKAQSTYSYALLTVIHCRPKYRIAIQSLVTLIHPGNFLDFHKKVSCKKSQLPCRFCSLGGKLGPQTASQTAARELARA